MLESKIQKYTMTKKTGNKGAGPRLLSSFTAPVCANIFTGEALAFLSGLESESADLIFLDPPFNLGKNYGAKAKDTRESADYRAWLMEILDQSIRVLADGGALYVYHLPSWAIEVGAYLHKSLVFRHWIAISMKNGFVRGQRLYPAHYALLFYTKGTAKSFNRPKLPLEFCQCGRTKKDYGGYRSIVEKSGLNLSDIWDDISPVRHAIKKRRVANELPSRITERVVSISGGPGLAFVDPFAGGGSAVLAAARAGMHVKACDAIRENASIQVRMLKKLEQNWS